PRSRDRRALHSFPTRRSSDLRDASQSEDAQPRQLHSGPALEAPGAVTSLRAPSSSRRVVNPSNLARTIPLPSTTKIHGSERRFQDRKSTRLNSSHDQISYAVF